MRIGVKFSTIRKTIFHLNSLVDAAFFTWMGTKMAGDGFSIIDLALASFIIGSIIKSNKRIIQMLEESNRQQFELKREVERLQNEKRIFEWQDRD